MKKILLAALVFLVSFSIGCSQSSQVTDSSDPYAGRPLKNITTLIDSRAKSIDWCHANNLISYEQHGSDGYVDILILNPDTGQKSQLTDGNPLCPQKSNGNSAWYPTGEYIVFTAEKESNPASLMHQAFPGYGYNCDLWLAKADGSVFWPLTDYPMYTRCVMHPHFSHSGTRLLWTECLGGSEGSVWGEWALKIADFTMDENGPHLANIKIYQSGQHHYFYEGHCFSADDNKILFTANSESQSDSGFDIYELELQTGKTIKLTDTPNDWDEHAHYSPDGKYIAWASATGLGINITNTSDFAWEKQLITELWLMNSDGTGKQRLTFFNSTGYPESLNGKRAIVADMTWSPDGKTIAIVVGLPDSTDARIFLVDFR